MKIFGGGWDAFGGAPDPFVEVRVSGKSSWRTSSSSNRFEASFNESTPEYSYEEVFGMKVYLYDEDISAHDLVLSGGGKEAPWLMNNPSSQEFTLESSKGKVSLRVDCDY
ncbi:MAG: hypothetical protein AAGJ35_00050 [Myxococcota bacterium]